MLPNCQVRHIGMSSFFLCTVPFLTNGDFINMQIGCISKVKLARTAAYITVSSSGEPWSKTPAPFKLGEARESGSGTW